MNYPRPNDGSKRGVHWTASNYPAHANFQWHLDWMLKCGIKWLKYVADGNASFGQGDSGIQVGVECLKRGIIPIHRFYLPADHVWTDANENAVRACVSAGIKYIEPMNEPDLLQVEWGTAPSKDQWLTRAFTTWIHQAKSILSLGGIPLSPALASGAFQDRGPDAGQVTVNPFEWVRDAGITDFVCAIHNYTGNHPIDYPYDDVNQNGKALTQAEYDKYGPEAWDYRSIADINAQRERDKNPGDTIDNDDSCFLAVMKFRTLLDDAGFNHVPIMTTEGGPVHTDLWDGRYPRVVPKLFIEMLEQELAWMADKDWYYCLCPWLWANNSAGGTGGWGDCQWYHPGHPWADSDGFMPVVKWLISRPISDDGNTTEPEETEEPEEEEQVTEIINDAESYGVTIIPAEVEVGDKYWKAIKVHHLTPEENNGQLHIFLDVLKENGTRYYGANVQGWWGAANNEQVIATVDKPPNEPGTNIVLSNIRQVTSVACLADGYDSDVVAGMHTNHPDEGPVTGWGHSGNAVGHHSFLVEFMLVTKTAEEETEEPTEPGPEESRDEFIRRMAWDRLYPQGIERNPDAAFQKYAVMHLWYAPTTKEFRAIYDDVIYAVQGFVDGIMACVEGDWENIFLLDWNA